MMKTADKKHLSAKKLGKEINNAIKNFSAEEYSKIEDIDKILLERNMSVEKKKGILTGKLHESIVHAFSIDKKKFSKKAFEAFKKRLHNIRKIVHKLRSINYYLETIFLDGLKPLQIRIKSKNSKLRRQSALARDEIEALECTAYKLIGEVVMLDKKLLKEYTGKERKILKEEKLEARDLGSVLGKESRLLEHLEAKLPPQKAVSASLVIEPIFTHWVARIFALLLYFEQMYAQEKAIFSHLKKNKAVRAKIGKKITHLIRESSKLLKIMEEKSVSMRKLRIDGEIKRELRNLTTIITI